jgi:hypothetical protein
VGILASEFKFSVRVGKYGQQKARCLRALAGSKKSYKINDLKMAVCAVTLAQFSTYSLFITEITGTLQIIMPDITHLILL